RATAKPSDQRAALLGTDDPSGFQMLAAGSSSRPCFARGQGSSRYGPGSQSRPRAPPSLAATSRPGTIAADPPNERAPMPTIDSNVAAFQQHFSVLDTAAKGGNADGKVSRKDIEAVASGGQYTPEQRAAAQHILDNPETYALLDTGRDGGGFGADGVISRQDVDAGMERAPLFEDTAAFTSDGVVVAQDSTHGLDDPRSAAAQTQLNGEGSATLFMQFVHAHGDDPQWLQGYFNALGAEQTAAYLSTVADPGRYTDLSADYAEGEIEAIRGALEGMYESGALNGSDIARLVEHWAMDRGDFSPGVAQLFGGLGGPRAEDMKNDFFRAAGELALAGQEVDNREFEFS